MKRVTFSGTGQLNGVKSINKTVDLEDRAIGDLYGQNRDEVILGYMAIYYPGVKINPRQIHVSVYDIPKEKKKIINNKPKKKFKFTFTNIFLWILFLPFKLMWSLLKQIWNEPHVKR